MLSCNHIFYSSQIATKSSQNPPKAAKISQKQPKAAYLGLIWAVFDSFPR
jgi:hypothetical protein